MAHPLFTSELWADEILAAYTRKILFDTPPPMISDDRLRLLIEEVTLAISDAQAEGFDEMRDILTELRWRRINDETLQKEVTQLRLENRKLQHGIDESPAGLPTKDRVKILG